MKKWLPLAVIILLMIVAYFLGLPKYLTFESIKMHREDLLTHIENHPILMPALFILLYIVAVSLFLPGGIILTLLGGFSFKIP
ncbi:hypothetical protein [Candidatus Neptunichlamydia sp. REUL1]|uniref:hypothetical protein n=1 Tax=Candidatus Neptunichlamydia sp. REUL1 TaxID=3064277 RepID=UPI00292F5D96|nr:hypothetical protein [Candidatus Neptunochlamydia sp. REUL1]